MNRLVAIILAGGYGKRFGSGKLLAPYGRGPLIQGAMRAARGAPVEEIVLVTGFDGDAVADAVMTFTAQDDETPTLRRVHADRYAEGMAATLKAGVASLSSTMEGAFVFLADMPHIPSWLPAALAGRIGSRAAAAPMWDGMRGHPVLFSARLFPALLALEGDQGARRILDELRDDLALVEVDDPGVRFDVDHRSDLPS